MQHANDPAMTDVSIELNCKTLDMAEQLGIDLSEMANRLLLEEVNKKLKQRHDKNTDAT
ncbi:type II toxin-antitoxin system CcdA family antitoxin [Polaromonas eurypsychrophila]|uniref:Uncharacterized protein n=1 Tax=Polaromonas eurypsychrophila TaxID=1614635 RepID=A0A916WKU6_9BURK|nr:type II toxin-antitoxin system CcdA family antitoxin [Polaromonas eurypsychrophila]GGB07372.1 hypothetical protein GCM10011496_30380 [Polaromonas eurypsychrophila]